MADEFNNRDNDFLLTRVTYGHFRGNYFCGDYNPHTLFHKSIKGTTIYVLDGWHSLNTVPIIMPEGRDGLSIINKGNNKITELRTILQRESQNS